MKRVVVNLATGAYYQRGQHRLAESIRIHSEDTTVMLWRDIPSDWPSHQKVPYGFKAYALAEAFNRLRDDGPVLLLWADASIAAIRSMEPLWRRIEDEGYWFSANGWMNNQWTADSAYPDLFWDMSYSQAREWNRKIPHVVATAFGISTAHQTGRAFLAEYGRLAKTTAFCGPWKNEPGTPCGPSDVLGHRHDQTAASVIAWRLGMQLTFSPHIFAYGKVGEKTDESTILLADGSYQ